MEFDELKKAWGQFNDKINCQEVVERPISLFYLVCSKFQVFQHFIHYKISGISPFIKSFFIRIIYNMVIIWNITKHPYQTSIFHTTEEACYAYPMVLNALRQGGIYKSVTHKVNTANVCTSIAAVPQIATYLPQ